MLKNKIDPSTRDYVKDLIRTHQDDLRSTFANFDKAILTISTGALGLSVTYFKTLIQNHCLLFFIVMCFVVSVISTVISFLFSARGTHKILRNLQVFLATGTDELKGETTNEMKMAETLNNVSVVAFILGILVGALTLLNGG